MFTLSARRARPRSRRLEATFQRLSRRMADFSGTAVAFCLACLSLMLWLVTGPLFHFSDAWQLVINTGTTIVTFLMVFLIQNAQNEDTRELHAKLDAVLQELRAERGMMHDPGLLALTPDEIVQEVRAGDD
ncbi:low affinity iron permease family protein [Deinococcus multiflagellatus]|uniref:Low affinity iron permease family protein n=1 Tax=Deinococcus multiflagellatus TaxID=1656887 RepID=A0ABW1ZHW4_9DEIO|nr:low affinity iron permease family protein [Deinococcus multiflagellatus]MBZ9711811.1 low affinity iron permease family protein [Deinococcus multiflagellatus]